MLAFKRSLIGLHLSDGVSNLITLTLWNDFTSNMMHIYVTQRRQIIWWNANLCSSYDIPGLYISCGFSFQEVQSSWGPCLPNNLAAWCFLSNMARTAKRWCSAARPRGTQPPSTGNQGLASLHSYPGMAPDPGIWQMINSNKTNSTPVCWPQFCCPERLHGPSAHVVRRKLMPPQLKWWQTQTNDKMMICY